MYDHILYQLLYKNKRFQKIILVCSAGMSTSILVKKMREEAKNRSLKAEINAYAEADLPSHLDEIDVILIGPQVRYLKGQMTERAEPYHTPVATRRHSG